MNGKKSREGDRDTRKSGAKKVMRKGGFREQERGKGESGI
jgi:hypothetical protein